MTQAPSTNSCVIYVRISQDQTGESLAVERQLEECEKLAESLGLTVTEVYRDEAVSATKANVIRHEFERLLADRPKVVVTWYVDRLYRKVTDLARIIESVQVVHSVRAGRIDLSTARWSRPCEHPSRQWLRWKASLKAERQLSKHAQRRKAGIPWWSHRPFGYSKDGTVVEAEAQHIRQALADLERGVAFAAIRERWNAAGILTSTGKAWSHSTFQTLIKSPPQRRPAPVRGRADQGRMDG